MSTARLSLGVVSLVFGFVIAACGGGAETKSPSTANDAKKADEKHESIGEAAAAQGGLASLGGAGNREESKGTGTEVSFAGPLRAETLSKKNPPKLDGMLKEWHARAPAKETLAGKTDGLGLDVAVQSGDEVFWIAAEVTDPKLTRSGKFGETEDHMTMTIAFPSGRGQLKAYEVGLWPGIPGSAPGVVKWTVGPNAGQKVNGAKVVEMDTKGGVTLEATIPWSNFPDATRVGMRAAFRWHDGDGSSVNGVLGTGLGTADKPGDLPALPISAEQAVLEGLLEQKGLAGTKPKIDLYADIAGDDRKERISVFGRFFTICGPGYRKGRQFFWREVQGEIVSLETKELTGHGKEELIVRRRVTQGSTNHDILEVWSIPVNSEEPGTVFAHQISIQSGDGKKRVSNAARLASKEIEISTEPAVGWDAASFNETIASDVEPLLLPWGAIKSKTFKLEGAKFSKASEVTQAGTAASASSGTSGTSGSEPMAKDPPTPAVKKGSDLGKQVLEAYMKDANVPAGAKPKFDIEVNVDGDAKPERVVVFGRDIVVLGPGFKNGTGYARLSLTQFADEKDITELTARDLNGNGAAEIIVRGQRHVKAPTGETIDIDGLFVYSAKGGNLTRVFAIETGREMGQKRVQGLVQFIPAKGGKGFDIDVRPGTAKGWSKENYPWPQDKPGSGPIEPLLLPWGGTSNLRYVWNGNAYATP